MWRPSLLRSHLGNTALGETLSLQGPQKDPVEGLSVIPEGKKEGVRLATWWKLPHTLPVDSFS